MFTSKKIGIVLIIAGLLIPLILYPFASPDIRTQIFQALLGKKGVYYSPRLYDLEVVFIHGTWKIDNKYSGHYVGRIAIPYRYMILMGVGLFFIGAYIVIRKREVGKKDN
jgi:hypothetical protein